MSQYIPPNAMHFVTGTWTQAAGAVTDTICMHKAAGANNPVINIPIMIPSNSVALKGSKLVSIEVDYELLLAGATSVTAVLNKITRGADTAVAVVAVPTITQDLAAGVAAASQEQHRLIVTLTTPAWIDNDEYYLLEVTMVCGGTVTVDVLGAVVNYTLRM
jgi:uncharacterized protein YunC (DUF1805 family)